MSMVPVAGSAVAVLAVVVSFILSVETTIDGALLVFDDMLVVLVCVAGTAVDSVLDDAVLVSVCLVDGAIVHEVHGVVVTMADGPVLVVGVRLILLPVW